MIRLLSPTVFSIAVAGAVVITALHFLSVRRPPVYLLPTARFLASRDVRAVSRSARPSDLLLLLLRVAALLLAGLAASGPMWTTDRASRAVVVVADPAWRSDSARLGEMAGAGTGAGAETLVRVVWADSTVGSDPAGMRAELGAAWPLAWRGVRALLLEQPGLDSIDLHVLAPGGSMSTAGWDAWRSTWPGRVVVHTRVASGGDTVADARGARGVRVMVDGGRADDVVRASLALHAPASPGDARGVRTVRVLRDSVRDSVADTVGAAGVDVRVAWPMDGVPAGWQRVRPDTAGAIVAGGIALVAPWRRTATIDAARTGARGTRVIAWWNDGTPAAVERTNTSSSGAVSCIRDVAIEVPNGSDLLLSASARGLLDALLAPCGPALAPIPGRIVEDSTGQGTPAQGRLASAAALRALSPVSTSVTPPWLPAALVALALALLLAEWSIRGRGDAAAASVATPLERAA